VGATSVEGGGLCLIAICMENDNRHVDKFQDADLGIRPWKSGGKDT
jgi:hypothetical protein